MRAVRKNKASDNDSLHSSYIDGPMEVGPVPYDDDLDFGPNGIMANTDRLRLNLYGLWFSDRLDDDLDNFSGCI